MIPIIVDHRERKYNDPNIAIPNLLKRRDIPITRTQLDVGDYIIQSDDFSICVEFKNAGDYINSIKNGRLNDELLSMSANYEYNILLVQGDVTDALIDSDMRRKTWFNFLAGCVVNIAPIGHQSRISVITVDDVQDAVEFLSTLYHKASTGNIFREPTAQKIKIPPGKEQLYTTMWMFPSNAHIGKKRAELLLKNFGSVRNIANATPDQLTNIDGIGDVIANNIIRHLNKEVYIDDQD